MGARRGELLSELSFFLLLGAFGALCGWEWLAAALLAALAHEAGHLLTLRCFGAGKGRMSVGPAGLQWRREKGRMLSYGRELLAVLAGPGANLLCAVLLARLSRETGWAGGYFLAGTQLALGGFNLLPILPLDGGRALELLFSWLVDPLWAWRAVSAVSLLTTGMLLASGIWLLALTSGGFLLLGALGVLGLTLREIGLVKEGRSG